MSPPEPQQQRQVTTIYICTAVTAAVHDIKMNTRNSKITSILYKM